MATGKSTLLPLAPVSHLHIEKIGLAIPFHIFLFSNRTFCSIKICGLGKHRIEKREKQAGSGAFDGVGAVECLSCDGSWLGTEFLFSFI